MRKTNMKEAGFKTVDWLTVRPSKNPEDPHTGNPGMMGAELRPSNGGDPLIQIKFWSVAEGTHGRWTQIVLDPKTHTVLAQTEPCKSEQKSWDRMRQMLAAKGIE